MKTNYIFVTGGVVSSLGKGIISASLGKLLQARGYSITIQKYDPYINIDPGTLNPYEHGECYVTIDGQETDLDLGHYERFTGIQTTRANNVTTGRIYQNVMERERQGGYLGRTIQVIPHITDEIKKNMRALGDTGKYDFIITEIGGTIGDIESLPFLESIRQLRWEMPENTVCLHLTYVPYIAAAGELKTKPTQHSVNNLQSLGIQPDILVLRAEHELPRSLMDKVSSFCNVEKQCVVQSPDLPSIYEVPVKMQEQGLDAAVLRKFGIDPSSSAADLKSWHQFLDKRNGAQRTLRIGLVGKYDLQDAYISIHESLSHAAAYNDCSASFVFINSEHLTKDNAADAIDACDGIIICPGFGTRGIEGKIIAAQYCREHDVPTFGICLGMQIMVIEYARNVLGLADANSREMDADTPNNVIDIMEEQKHITNMGGTMRLGGYECHLLPGSKIHEAYGVDDIVERHRHRYEFNNDFRSSFEAKGMRCVGFNPQNGLVEAVESENNSWYIGVQYHPEYSSTVLKPHPLFMSFIKEIISRS